MHLWINTYLYLCISIYIHTHTHTYFIFIGNTGIAKEQTTLLLKSSLDLEKKKTKGIFCEYFCIIALRWYKFSTRCGPVSTKYKKWFMTTKNLPIFKVTGNVKQGIYYSYAQCALKTFCTRGGKNYFAHDSLRIRHTSWVQCNLSGLETQYWTSSYRFESVRSIQLPTQRKYVTHDQWNGSDYFKVRVRIGFDIFSCLILYFICIYFY